MKHLLLFFVPALACIAMVGPCIADTPVPHPATITELDVEKPEIPLPRPILNRMKVAELQAPEVREAWKQLMPDMKEDSMVDLNATANATLYRAADGTTYCCDQSTMSLWIHSGETWECFLQGLRVNKTFGGMPPHLPVKYLGKGFFAFSQTTPNDEEQKPEDRFPQARAVTYLLDSKSAEVIARSKSFRYDHTPPVKVPPEWYSRIGIAPLPTPE